jgi:hypothetical protein
VTNIFTSTLSFVERMGKDGLTGIKDIALFGQKVQPVANFIGSVIALADPLLAPVVTTVLSTASYVEGQFAAAGAATGTGAQKLSTVTTLIGPLVSSGLKAAGKPNAAADVNSFISGVVNLGKNDPNIWQELEALLGNPPAAAVPIAAVASAHSQPIAATSAAVK